MHVSCVLLEWRCHLCVIWRWLEDTFEQCASGRATQQPLSARRNLVQCTTRVSYLTHAFTAALAGLGSVCTARNLMLLLSILLDGYRLGWNIVKNNGSDNKIFLYSVLIFNEVIWCVNDLFVNLESLTSVFCWFYINFKSTRNECCRIEPGFIQPNLQNLTEWRPCTTVSTKIDAGSHHKLNVKIRLLYM